MIPIYLCDDEPAVRRGIRTELEKEILISGYDMEVVCDTGDPEELLDAVRRNGKRGIYFLDVDLKDGRYTGFTLGQEVRKEDPRGFLVYVTAFGELAFETFRYKLEALDYIVKADPEEMFRGMDISWYILSRSGGRCLILFYREAGLSAHLNSRAVRRLIREYGYTDKMELSEMLARLSGRARDFAERDMGFPHEIGAFLGYPAEDVRGFIENQGRKFLMTGYWKVYSDPERAGIIFKEFDRAKICAVNEFLTGKSIREIAL